MADGATSSTFERALIEVLDPRGNRKDPPVEIPVMFNPTEYSLDKRLNYGEVTRPGKTTPARQFVGGDVETLSAELFFDTYERGRDVREEHTDRIDRLMVLDDDYDPPSPPKCRFAWGSLVFEGVLESANKTFTMFDRGGVPVRARIDVTFQGHRIHEAESADHRGQSGDRREHSGGGTKTRRVKQGDTLWAIAGTEYGDPRRWRRIADANGVDDPRTLQIGRVLTIPPAEE
jgi:hypothetical protein